MLAEDFVRLYHHIKVPEFKPRPGGAEDLFGAHERAAPVREYTARHSTNRHGLSYAQRVKLKDLMLYSFLPRMAKSPERTGVMKSAAGYSLANSWAPIRDLPASTFSKVFRGKASPREMAQVIQVMNYWRYREEEIEGNDVGELAQLVEQHLGLDDTGFIYNYLRIKFQVLDVDLGPCEDAVMARARKGGVLRSKLQEVREDDLLLFEGHVAIISRVLAVGASGAMLAVSESRSGREVHGGPQTRRYHLGWSAGQFQLSGREPLVAICRLPGM